MSTRPLQWARSGERHAALLFCLQWVLWPVNYKKWAAMRAGIVGHWFPERADSMSPLSWGEMAKSTRSMRMCASARVSVHPAPSVSLNYVEKRWGVHPVRKRKNWIKTGLKEHLLCLPKCNWACGFIFGKPYDLRKYVAITGGLSCIRFKTGSKLSTAVGHWAWNLPATFWVCTYQLGFCNCRTMG